MVRYVKVQGMSMSTDEKSPFHGGKLLKLSRRKFKLVKLMPKKKRALKKRKRPNVKIGIKTKGKGVYEHIYTGKGKSIYAK